MVYLPYTYALIRSFHDEKKDFVDAFSPIIILFLRDKKDYLDLEIIKSGLEEKYGLELPQKVLFAILQRYANDDILSIKGNKYRLSKAGYAYSMEFETEEDIKTRIDPLFSNFKFYLNTEKNYPATIEECKDILNKCIQKNVEAMAYLVEPEFRIKEIEIKHKLEKYVYEYSQKLKETNDNYYNYLKEIILGAIISLAININDGLTDKGKRIENVDVFLDTNILFSLLDLHHPQFSKPIKELIELVKSWGFRLKVFSFTVEEATRVLKDCTLAFNLEKASPKINVNKICTIIKNQGLNEDDIGLHIANIDNYIKNLDIEIEWFDVDLNNFVPKDENIRNALHSRNPSKSREVENHDIAAIEIIKEKREHKQKKLEEAKAVFLTADQKLWESNFLDLGHKRNGTIPEVLVDRLMTNLLWLKNPSTHISLETLMATCSRDALVRKKIWNAFLNRLSELRKKDKISDEDITILLLSDAIEDALSDLDERDEKSLDESFIFVEIKKAEILKDKEKVVKEELIKEKEELTIEIEAKSIEIKEKDDKLKTKDNNIKEKEEEIDKKSKELEDKIKKLDDKEKTILELEKNNQNKQGFIDSLYRNLRKAEFEKLELVTRTKKLEKERMQTALKKKCRYYSICLVLVVLGLPIGYTLFQGIKYGDLNNFYILVGMITFIGFVILLLDKFYPVIDLSHYGMWLETIIYGRIKKDNIGLLMSYQMNRDQGDEDLHSNEEFIEIRNVSEFHQEINNPILVINSERIMIPMVNKYIIPLGYCRIRMCDGNTDECNIYMNNSKKIWTDNHIKIELFANNKLIDEINAVIPFINA